MDDCAFYNNQETEKRNNSTIVEQHQTNQQPAFTNELQLTWKSTVDMTTATNQPITKQMTYMFIGR